VAVVGDSLAREPPAQLDLRDDGTAEALVDRDRVTDVIPVSVREQDQVAALGLDFTLGASRVALQERITWAAARESTNAECPSQVNSVGMSEI
jgi:hypothetical protein